MFVDGCFWHGHNCRNIKPSSNVEYWKKKISKNKERDTLVNNYFMNKGWFIVRIKECEIKKNEEQVADKIKNLLRESSLIY